MKISTVEYMKNWSYTAKWVRNWSRRQGSSNDNSCIGPPKLVIYRSKYAEFNFLGIPKRKQFLLFAQISYLQKQGEVGVGRLVVIAVVRNLQIYTYRVV